MKLAELLGFFASLKWGDAANKDVSLLCADSREVNKGAVFVAIRGEKLDGNNFLQAAIQAGAIGLVVETEAQVPMSFPGAVALVPDTRRALSELADRFYGSPSKSLFCTGVTGTNGKTTTTHLIEAILTEFGWPTAVIGTINHHLGSHIWKTELTTPDPVSFQRRLAEFLALGAKAVAMEVSSHALSQQRVDAVQFDCAVFTNLSRDHLDFHSDMEEYFMAKSRLFTELLENSDKDQRTAVINHDDRYCLRLELSTRTRRVTYGGNGADLSFEVLQMDYSGSRFRVHALSGNQEFQIQLPGLYNIYNACAAIGVGLAAGCGLETCARALREVRGVNGRLQAIENPRGLHVFIDYAHTDDALKNVLSTLGRIRRESGLKNRIVTVFGCGGDRDKGKRPLMMSAALSGSDLVYLTSDNPRSEDPAAIIAETLRGAQAAERSRVVCEVNRRAAIHAALRETHPGDVVLIAGKGHEDYQIIGHEKTKFSDAEVVKEFFK